MILRDLMMAIKAILPSAADVDSKKTFVAWLQMCRDADKEHNDQLVVLRMALQNFGTHSDDCNAVKKIGRFGSRKGLKWSVSDDDAKTCSCGLAKALS